MRYPASHHALLLLLTTPPPLLVLQHLYLATELTKVLHYDTKHHRGRYGKPVSSATGWVEVALESLTFNWRKPTDVKRREAKSWIGCGLNVTYDWCIIILWQGPRFWLTSSGLQNHPTETSTPVWGPTASCRNACCSPHDLITFKRSPLHSIVLFYISVKYVAHSFHSCQIFPSSIQNKQSAE